MKNSREPGSQGQSTRGLPIRRTFAWVVALGAMMAARPDARAQNDVKATAISIPRPTTTTVIDEGKPCGGWKCATLQDLANNDPSQAIALRNYCVANAEKLPRHVGALAGLFTKAQQRADIEKKVCVVAAQLNVDGTGKVTNPDVGKQISILDASAVLFERVNATGCSGWGITVPLYSVRYNSTHEVKGPIASGLGGGYYLAATCRSTSTVGLEAFAYSEGLDPAKLLHVGIAAGPQLVVFEKFSFGLAFGYDIYRHIPGADGAAAQRNGLLTGAFEKQDLSALITFSVVQSADSKSAPKVP